MLKKYRATIVICTILCLLPILVGGYYWNELPDMMVTHWDMHNKPNGYMPKAVAVFLLPVLMTALLFLCPLAAKIDPKKPVYNDKMIAIMLWTMPIMSLLLSAMTYGWALGFEFDIGFWATIFLGILFVLIGNYLPKCTPSFTMGIKLPWTLSDDENWRKTHRMAGPIWVFGGVLIIVSTFLKITWMIAPALIIMIIAPTVYSYLYYRKQSK